MIWAAPIPAVVLDNSMSLNEYLFAQNTLSSSILMDKDGLNNTEYLVNSSDQEGYEYDAAMMCDQLSNYMTNLFPVHDSISKLNIPSYLKKWYIPSIVELMVAMSYRIDIEDTLENILTELYTIYNDIQNNNGGGGEEIIKTNDAKSINNIVIWSSTEFNNESAFVFNNGQIFAGQKNCSYVVTPFCRIPCIIKE